MLSIEQKKYLYHNYYTSSKVEKMMNGDMIVYQKVLSTFTGNRLVKKIVDKKGIVVQSEYIPYREQLWNNLYTITDWEENFCRN